VEKIGSTTLTEVFLIDNNSNPPIAEDEVIKGSLEKMPWCKLILEPKPGLTFARIAGARSASGDVLIYFDDDNEPDTDYIEELQHLNRRYPEVGIWGPGIVSVDFFDGVDEKMKDCLKPIFQERNQRFIEFSLLRSWQNCYPFGTGLCVKRSILIEYASNFESNQFTLKDRTGNSLSSGGDTQLVLYGISKGYAAGTSPSLKVTHMIGAKKLKASYLKRLAIGTGICYYRCHSEVFSEFLTSLQNQQWNDSRIINKIVRRYLKLKVKPNLTKELSLIAELAHLISRYEVLKKPLPKPVDWIYRKIEKASRKDT
jgi:glycosyltransferase involved in cell wall biosynthesis